MNKHMNDWMDKAEGKPVGSSNAGIAKERVRQGYDKSKVKKHEMAKKMTKSYSGHYQEGADGKIRQLSQKAAEKKGMGTY